VRQLEGDQKIVKREAKCREKLLYDSLTLISSDGTYYKRDEPCLEFKQERQEVYGFNESQTRRQ
jgi:hypothetical protein